LIRVTRVKMGKTKMRIARTRMGTREDNRVITNPHLHILRET